MGVLKELDKASGGKTVWQDAAEATPTLQ